MVTEPTIMSLNLTDDAGIFKRGKLGLVDDVGIFEPLVDKPSWMDKIGLTRAISDYETKARAKGAIASGLLAAPVAGIAGLGRLLLDPHGEFDVSKAAETFKKVASGPARLFLKTPAQVEAAEKMMKPLDVIDKASTFIAGAFYEAGFEKTGTPDFIGSMIDESMEGPNPNLAASIATGIQTAIIFGGPKLTGNLLKSTWFRKLNIKQKGLVLQSLEDTIAKNPKMTEGDILRKWNNPKWYEEALTKRMKGEPTIEPKGPIPGQPGAAFPQEIPSVPPGPPLAPTALKPKPQVIPLSPVSSEPGIGLFEEAGGPMIGKDFIEGTGEIQRPYPGQRRLGGPLKRILPPRIPGIQAPPTDIGPKGPGQWKPPTVATDKTIPQKAVADKAELIEEKGRGVTVGKIKPEIIADELGIKYNGYWKDVDKHLWTDTKIKGQESSFASKTLDMAEVKERLAKTREGYEKAEKVAEPVVDKKPVAKGKEPWEITEKEFFEEYRFHGSPKIKGAKIKTGTFFSDYEYARGYAKKPGEYPGSGEIYAVRKSELKPIKADVEDVFGQAEIDVKGSIRSGREHKVFKVRDFKPHKVIIQQALSEGKSIPAKVLAEYPDLKVKEPVKPKPVKLAKPEIKPLSFEAWKSTRPKGEVNLEKKYQEYLKKPKTELAVSDTIEALYRETTTVPSAKKKKIIETIKSQLKSEEGNIRLDTIIENIDAIKKIAKDANVNITDKDIKFLEEQIRLPYWRAKSDPAFARVYKVQERRETNRNVIRTTFLEDLLPALELKGKEAKELGELLHRGDILKGELGEKGLAKLNPAVRKGYLAVRDILNYIWFEHLPQELKNLGYSKTEIDDYRRQLGRVKGYFPHMRKGRYHIKVKAEPGDKAVLYREHFDDIITTLTRGKVSYKAPIKLRRIRKEYPDATIIGPERNVEVPEELFFAIDPVALEQIIKFASKKVDVPDPKAFDKALQQAMAEVIQSRGFMVHGIKRRGIPGYDRKHWKQALVEYISGYAGMITKLHAAKGFESAIYKIDKIKTPGKARYASKYIHDVMRNQEQFDTTVDKFRGLMFYKYLGAVVKSATLNLTQNYIAGVPRLSVETKWGSAKITLEMEEAGRTVFKSLYDKNAKGKRLSLEEQAGLNAARKKGIISDQWTQELMGYALGGYDTVTRKIGNIMKFMFGRSEIFNREVMYVVAFRIARHEKQLGVSKSWEFAETIVKDVHFVYGKGNLPAVTRGSKPATAARGAYTFRTYPHQLMSLHRWLLKEYGKDIKGKRTIPYSRTKGSYASIKGLLALMAFAGLSGIPFYKDLIEYYQKTTGEDIEQAILQKAGRAKNVINYGLPGLIGIDFSGSISMELPSKISDLGGVVTQIPKDIIKTKEDIGRENYLRGIEDFPATPSVFKYIMAAQRMRKGITSRRGLKILDEKGLPIKLNAWETFLKTIGFQPVKASEIYRKRSAEYRRTSYWNKMRDNVIDVAISEYYESEGKPGKFPSPDLLNAISEFNTKKPPDIVPILVQTLMGRIGQKKTKRQRYRKQVIK